MDLLDQIADASLHDPGAGLHAIDNVMRSVAAADCAPHLTGQYT